LLLLVYYVNGSKDPNEPLHFLSNWQVFGDVLVLYYVKEAVVVVDPHSQAVCFFQREHLFFSQTLKSEALEHSLNQTASEVVHF
jgi:hypothetical protein